MPSQLKILHCADMGRRKGILRGGGFALLEAIVSLALLSGIGLALFGWVNQNIQTAARLAGKQRELRLQLNAQAFVETINPALQPEGEFRDPDMELKWRASLVEPMRSNIGLDGQAGIWRLGLYSVEVVATAPGEGVVSRFKQLQAGWQPAVRAGAAP